MRRLPKKTSGPIRAGAGGDGSARVSGGPNNIDPADALHGSPGAPFNLRLLRFPAVRDRTGLSRSTIWRLERQGAFPKHHRISANAVAWSEDDVANWIRSKVNDIAV